MLLSHNAVDSLGRYADGSDSAVEQLSIAFIARAKYDQNYLLEKAGLLNKSAELRFSLATNFTLNLSTSLDSVNITQLLACATYQPEARQHTLARDTRAHARARAHAHRPKPQPSAPLVPRRRTGRIIARAVVARI